MKKIGIIGGTFDPIHNGHLYIAYEASLKLNLDKVIFLIAGNPPHKINKEVSSANIRKKMVESSIKDFPNFEISEYEINKKEKSYTYESLGYFKEIYSDSEIYFITGGDCLINIETWKNVDDIFKLSNLVVFTRGGIEESTLEEQKRYINKKYNSNIIFLNLLQLEISSSMIRSRVSRNERIDFFLPKKVIEVIEENKLYRGKKNVEHRKNTEVLNG